MTATFQLLPICTVATTGSKSIETLQLKYKSCVASFYTVLPNSSFPQAMGSTEEDEAASSSRGF